MRSSLARPPLRCAGAACRFRGLARAGWAIRAILESFDGPARLMPARQEDTLNDQARAYLHSVPANDSIVELYSEAPLPTRHGQLRVYVFREPGTEKEHVAA